MKIDMYTDYVELFAEHFVLVILALFAIPIIFGFIMSGFSGTSTSSSSGNYRYYSNQTTRLDYKCNEYECLRHFSYEEVIEWENNEPLCPYCGSHYVDEL